MMIGSTTMMMQLVCADRFMCAPRFSSFWFMCLHLHSWVYYFKILLFVCGQMQAAKLQGAAVTVETVASRENFKGSEPHKGPVSSFLLTCLTFEGLRILSDPGALMTSPVCLFTTYIFIYQVVLEGQLAASPQFTVFMVKKRDKKRSCWLERQWFLWQSVRTVFCKLYMVLRMDHSCANRPLEHELPNYSFYIFKHVSRFSATSPGVERRSL